MFIIESQTAKASIIKQEEANAIVDAMGASDQEGIMRSMIKAACRNASLDVGSLDHSSILVDRRSYLYDGREKPLIGDVFFYNDNLLILEPSKSKIQISEVRHCAASSVLPDFCELVTKAAQEAIDGRRLRGMSFNWEGAEPDFSSFEGRYSRQRKTENLKSISPEYSADESAKSAALINSENRNLLITLAQARGKALSVDADSDSEGKGAPRLLSAGLIQKEYLVKCRKDQHLIGSIDDQKQLSSTAGELFRCTTCGRHFKDEIVEEIYVLSEVGRQLLSSSRWMMVWVTEILHKSGVPTELISWNGSASDDEIDIMVDIHGTKIFFELKDRDFDLGDAYPFAFRVARYGGDYGVIVTTGKVAAEVKSFLKESPREFGNVAFRTIEGEKAIEDELPKVMNSLSQVNVRRLIYPVSEYSGFNLIPYVNAWMQRIADEYKEKVSVLATAV